MSKLLQLCREGFALLLRGSLEQSALAAEEQYLALLDYRVSHCPPIPRD
ncbi:hypothetical protein KRX52_05285 [Pseudomonas sp. MAP12]|uniref:Uncharacterized protein n=1 Tax=Geopseudomonas aromaticivorans TaxID=2849492 RepID=A0ABS6MTS3_9GAMM|nr:hypothetical protein [Pseudomonas aromaticivorans]MBV2132211.1 hypothetical protein [Pseudomonas aromaticivorans]